MTILNAEKEGGTFHSCILQTSSWSIPMHLLEKIIHRYFMAVWQRGREPKEHTNNYAIECIKNGESWTKWYRTDSLGGLLLMAHVPEKRNVESSLGISTTHSNYTNHNTKSNLIFYLKTTLQLCLFK